MTLNSFPGIIFVGHFMISTGRQSGWYSDLQASWGPWWRFKFLNLFSMFHMRDKLHTINQMPSTVLNTELNKRQSWFLNIRTHWTTDGVSEWFSMLPCFPALTIHVSSLRLCAKERGFFTFLIWPLLQVENFDAKRFPGIVLF